MDLSNGQNVDVRSLASVSTQWTHIAVTYSSNRQVQIFFNGKLYATHTSSEPPKTYNSEKWRVFFGKSHQNDPNSQTFQGSISEARIYSTALTQAGISNIYTTELPNFQSEF